MRMKIGDKRYTPSPTFPVMLCCSRRLYSAACRGDNLCRIILRASERQQDIRLHMRRTRCRYLRRLHICSRPQRLRQQDILLRRNRKRCIHQKFYMPWKNTSLSCCLYCSSFGTKKQVVCQKIQIRVTFHPIFYRPGRSWARFHADVYRVR